MNTGKYGKIRKNAESLQPREFGASPFRWPWDRKNNPTKIRLPLNFGWATKCNFHSIQNIYSFSRYIYNILSVCRAGLDSFYCSVCCRVLFFLGGLFRILRAFLLSIGEFSFIKSKWVYVTKNPWIKFCKIILYERCFNFEWNFFTFFLHIFW